MKLEGTLDAFSLPEIFQLLSWTSKTGTLHLRRGARHGAVHLRDGAVVGARADVGRQELGRRLVGAGLVSDEALASAAEQLAEDPTRGLARLLADRAGLDPAVTGALAAEHATDAVFDLLRWPDGEFSFVVGEADPDDLGARLAVAEVVEEGRRRLEVWGALAASVPAADAVLHLHPAPPDEPVLSRDEWSLLALVDGRRTVADLVALAGRGEYAVVSALAGLVARGLLAASGPADDRSTRRQALLAALEGRAPEPAAAGDVPEPAAGDASAEPVPSGAVVPQRREPFAAPRRPEHAELTAVPVGTLGTGPAVDGANALAPVGAAAPTPVISPDPSIDRTLLLRLIAGVRGL